MFHTFLFLYNAQKIVYAPKYAPFILAVFLIECMFVSWLIEKLKNLSGINHWIRRIGLGISGKEEKSATAQENFCG